MPKKRQEMAVGSWDNITERCPQHTYRLTTWCLEELTAWLCLHFLRYMRAEEGLIAAIKNGSDSEEQRRFAAAAQKCISILAVGVNYKWSAAEWREACDLAVTLMRHDGRLALTDGFAPPTADDAAAVTDAT